MKGWIGKLLTLALTFSSGGLAGAVYSHYANRPEPTSVAAAVSTVTIANPVSAGSLIPDLRVEVGNQAIGSLYAQIVTLDVISGPYAEAADVAISFPERPHIYGKPVTSVPTPLHSMDCTPIANGFRCRIAPLKTNSGGPFRVSIATDQPGQPKVAIVAKDVQLATVDEIAARKTSWWGSPLFAGVVGLVGTLGTVTLSFLARSVTKLNTAVDSIALKSGAWPRGRDNLLIIGALYGTGEHRIDVTDKLNSAIIDSRLRISVGNDLGGDPSPGRPKDLIVNYTYKDHPRHTTVPEGATLVLPETRLETEK